MIKLIIFDLSGVCFSEEESPFIESFAKQMGLDVENFVERHDELIHSAERDDISGKEAWNTLSDEFNFSIDIDKTIRDMINTKEIYLETLELARKLRGKYKTAYYTNYSRDYWKIVQEKFDITPYFDFGIVSFTINSRKPESKGFTAILDHFGFRGDEALFLDDSEKNVDAARKLGINAFHVKDRNKIRKLLKEGNVDIS